MHRLKIIAADTRGLLVRRIANMYTSTTLFQVQTSREVCKKARVSSLSYTDTCEKVFKQGPEKLRRYSTHVR